MLNFCTTLYEHIHQIERQFETYLNCVDMDLLCKKAVDTARELITYKRP